MYNRLASDARRTACLCLPVLGPRGVTPLLAFLLVLNVTKNAEPVACTEIWLSPAQTNAGKSFRAET